MSSKKEIFGIDNIPRTLNINQDKFNEKFETLESIKFDKIKENKSKQNLQMKKILKEKRERKNKNELIISTKLENINKINCYMNLGIKNGIDCTSMEYTKYGNLIEFKEYFKINNLSESLLCFLSSQILNALKYLNICKIVHMDIKPQNIVIDECLNAKLIDFSVSTNYSKYNYKEIKLPFEGTNCYMAPEIILKKIIKVKDLNKVDLYSLGVLLYYLAFGYYPYKIKFEDSKDKIEIIENENIGINKKGFSSLFINFLKNLLEKNIEKRINIYEALDHFWIKGAKILLDEKEKLDNSEKFIFVLNNSLIKKFNDYIKN